MKQTLNWLSHRKLMVLFACLILGAAVMLSVAQAALTPSPVAPCPTITIVSLALASCGTECTGVKVTWGKGITTGATITGYKVSVTPPSPCAGCFSPIAAVPAGPTATSATVGITSAGALPPGTYIATVTATFSAQTTASKSQAL